MNTSHTSLTETFKTATSRTLSARDDLYCEWFTFTSDSFVDHDHDNPEVLTKISEFHKTDAEEIYSLNLNHIAHLFLVYSAKNILISTYSRGNDPISHAITVTIIFYMWIKCQRWHASNLIGFLCQCFSKSQ